jgi:hypothetical protein
MMSKSTTQQNQFYTFEPIEALLKIWVIDRENTTFILLKTLSANDIFDIKSFHLDFH